MDKRHAIRRLFWAQLMAWVFCSASSVEAFSVSRYRLPIDVDGHVVTIPYCWNHRIDKPNPNITRAIIVLHGKGRNADSYFSNMVAAAVKAGQAFKKPQPTKYSPYPVGMTNSGMPSSQYQP